MRNLLLALTTGFLAAEFLSFYRTSTTRAVIRQRGRELDAVLDDSFPASDALNWTAEQVSTKTYR